jgi:hypothetical protein
LFGISNAEFGHIHSHPNGIGSEKSSLRAGFSPHIHPSAIDDMSFRKATEFICMPCFFTKDNKNIPKNRLPQKYCYRSEIFTYKIFHIKIP